MKLVSYFSVLRLNYYELSKIKAFSEITKWLSEKEIHRGDTWQHQSVPRGMMTSARRHHDVISGSCNEHGTIYAISSDFGDQMTTQHLD